MHTTAAVITGLKPIIQACLFLVWVTAYLASVYWIGRRRRARLARPAGTGAPEYRADKDVGLWLAAFAVGLILLAIVFLGTQVITHSL